MLSSVLSHGRIAVTVADFRHGDDDSMAHVHDAVDALARVCRPLCYLVLG